MKHKKTHLIVYISKSEIDSDYSQEAIDEICELSQRENARRDITGILFHENGYFVQAIEGDESVLKQLMKNIKADKRHSQVKILIEKPVHTRIFPGWAMRGLSLADYTLFNPEAIGYLHKIYEQNVAINDASFVLFLENMINDLNFQSLFS